jgi:hypothetical protein
LPDPTNARNQFPCALQQSPAAICYPFEIRDMKSTAFALSQDSKRCILLPGTSHQWRLIGVIEGRTVEDMTLEHATSVQLAKQDGAEFRSVRLNIGGDGTIRMDTHDMGPNVERVWDHEDYEFFVEVSPLALGRLAFELLRDKFAGNLKAVSDFRNFCEERGIAHEFQSWP